MAYDLSSETRIEYLERNIAEISLEIRILSNASWEKVKRERPGLERQRQKLVSELNEVCPYKIEQNGNKFIVAHKGMFVCGDDGAWLSFDSMKSAQAWIEAA
ncbi:MAG: hypothetical protein AAFN44_17795 [Pseudomonadota bacterium]